MLTSHRLSSATVYPHTKIDWPPPKAVYEGIYDRDEATEGEKSRTKSKRGHWCQILLVAPENKNIFLLENLLLSQRSHDCKPDMKIKVWNSF